MAADPPIFHVHRQGRLANQMIQYMIALKFVSLMPESRIANVSLPEWGIELPAIEDSRPTHVVYDEQHVDFAGMIARLEVGDAGRIEYRGFGQRLENFWSPAAYRDVFRPPFAEPVGCGPNELVCHVRAGDILHSGHPDHVLTPVEFYADLVHATGLDPVFMGETEPSPYTDRLRARFPRARFLPRGDIVRDFEIIRQSRNIAIGVTTFCWLAAWLSHADAIFMSVNGLFNPRQYPAIDLVPYDDPRFRFYLFPLNYAVPAPRLDEAHAPMRGLWRRVAPDLLRRMVREAPRVPRRIEPYLTLFDEAHYLQNADVRGAVEAGYYVNGRQHYIDNGFREGRAAFALDPVWYSRVHPLAAFEVAQGDYLDFAHLHAEIGHARGYAATPGA